MNRSFLKNLKLEIFVFVIYLCTVTTFLKMEGAKRMKREEEEEHKLYGGELGLNMARSFNLKSKKYKLTKYGLDEVLDIKSLLLPIRRYEETEVRWTFDSPLTLRELVTKIGDFYASKIAPEHMLTGQERDTESFYEGEYKPKIYRQLITRDGSGLCFWEGISCDKQGNAMLCLGS